MKTDIYRSADFFMFRVANLAHDTLRQLESCSPNKIVSLWQELPLFKKAVAIASPDLYRSMQKGGGEKIFSSLLKYLIRMCSRADLAPFFSPVLTRGSS